MKVDLTMPETKPITITDTVKQYGRQLFGFIRGKTKSIEDAEDILQEVWYQLSRLGNIQDLENISAWLYTVSRNKITDLYRKKKTDNLENYAYEDEAGSLEIKDLLLLDDSTNPELALFNEMVWNTLQQALDELPEPQRKVFIEHELEDKTLQQIADEQQENIKTIISRKGYAVKHIRERLRPLYEELNKHLS